MSFNHERHRLEAIRKVLLEKEFGPEKPLTLFEQFKDDWQADLFDELRQLRILYLEIESMEERYQIFAPPHTSPAMNRPTDAMVDLSLEDRRETKLQESATRKQLTFWALRDSKRTESLLIRLEQWVNRFREAVAMFVLLCTSPIHADLSQVFMGLFQRQTAASADRTRQRCSSLRPC